MLSRFLLITSILLCAQASFAQSLNADRPQFSISGEIVGIKTFAIEFGTDVDINTRNNYGFQYADLLVRIGTMKLMEMTLSLNSPGTLVKNGGVTQHNAGFASPELGLKILMKEKEDGSKMGMAFAGGAGFNFGSKQFKNTKILPSFKIAMDIDWSASTNMRVNYGVIWQENRLVIDPEGNPVIDPFISLSTAVTHQVNEKLAVFGEVYALVKHDNFKSDYRINTGLLIYVKEHVQLDISGGAGLSPASTRGFLSVGFAGLWPEKNRTATGE